jgi:hypothetical protein
MKRKHYLLLFIIGLAVILAEAMPLPVPGYMDAEYYFAGGSQLAAGKGFTEPFLWNYLDDPAGLPHPAFTYWMPLTSLLAALGMFISGKIDFLGGRIAFFIIAAVIPPLTAYLSFRLSHSTLAAWLAGGLAIFPGFYAIYMGLTDTFATYMLLGSAFLILAFDIKIRPVVKFIGLGFIAGLMHLARADGILWLGAGIFLAAFSQEVEKQPRQLAFKRIVVQVAGLMLGYLLLMAPWYARNLSLYGALFSPASGRALWITDYNQMFDYPASQITLQNWLSAGLPAALNDRLSALGLNLQTALAVQSDIFLLPLVLIGLWRLRKVKLVQGGLAMWGLTFLVMTVIFPLAGGRGGFFHSGAAVQPLLWAISIEGFMGLIAVGVKKRNWKFERAERGFGLILIFLCLMLTFALFLPQITSTGSGSSAWTNSSETYKAVDNFLRESGAGQGQTVMVNNAPGYFVATGRSAVVIPNGDTTTVFAAAMQFGVSYLVLEQNTVEGLQALYKSPMSQPGLVYLQTMDQAAIFRIETP